MKRNPIGQDSMFYRGTSGDNVSQRIKRLALVVSRRSSLIEHSLDILAVVDRQGKLQFINPAMMALLGHPDASILGKPFAQLIHAADRAAAIAAMDKTNLYPSKRKRKWQLIHLDGGVKIFEVNLQNLLADPDVAGTLVTLHDVTEQHKLEVELVHRAFHDTLTGLPNRALFFDRMRSALKRAKRSRAKTGLLFIDIVDFKGINDRFGHIEGDRVLAELAIRLNACVRSCDTIARIGGDEFTVLVEDFGTEKDLANVADAIHESLKAPISVCEQPVAILASIGIAICDCDSTADSLLSDADAAMYIAKGSQAIVATFGPRTATEKANVFGAELR